MRTESSGPGFYNGTQTGGNAANPHKTGHIQGAKNVPFTDTVNADNTLQPADALQKLFADAGVSRATRWSRKDYPVVKQARGP